MSHHCSRRKGGSSERGLRRGWFPYFRWYPSQDGKRWVSHEKGSWIPFHSMLFLALRGNQVQPLRNSGGVIVITVFTGECPALRIQLRKLSSHNRILRPQFQCDRQHRIPGSEGFFAARHTVAGSHIGAKGFVDRIETDEVAHNEQPLL